MRSASTSTATSERAFDDAVTEYRRALSAMVKGDPKPVTEFFSRRDDVTLANPILPPQLGPAAVGKAIAEAATHLRDGSVLGFEEVSRYVTADLGYVVQIERTQARLAGSEDVIPLALRVTMIFRREGDAWKVAHRHADPITTPQPIDSVLQAK
jgi:ketosteroid isomerase-like protein